MRADGTFVTYWYAWKAGPRLPGNPGEPEFMAAYNAAVARKVVPKAGTMFSILRGYQESAEFDKLRPRTKSDYIRLIKAIEQKFGTFPLSAMTDPRTRNIFMTWRDELAKASKRQADYSWSVLARVLSWAHGRRIIAENPCTRGGRLYSGSRVDKIWSDECEEAFLALAPEHLHLALVLALWTGQREGDLLALTWTQYDGRAIRLRQGKTGVRVTVPAGSSLKERLDAARQSSGPVLLNSRGQPWTSNGFSSSWRKACKKAGIVGVTFNDLRGTAVTRLAVCGCTEAEIASLTGHSLKQVRSILDAHYLHRDPQLAVNAIRKLETRTKIPNLASN